MDLHFIDANGNHFVVPDAPEGYVREGATLISPPPSLDHRWIDGEWRVPAPAPEPVPEAISDRQFAQQLAVLGTITWDEAIGWAARGDLPLAMEAAVASLPEEQRNPARMLMSSATTYERSHPLVPMLGALLQYDDAELDQLWRDASAL